MKIMYRLPLGEIVIDFYDRLKQLSSGYASFDYEDAGYQKANRVKIGVRLDGESIEPLATVCTVANAEKHARSIVHKLKEQIPKQMHEVAIQATQGSKILARATCVAYALFPLEVTDHVQCQGSAKGCNGKVLRRGCLSKEEITREAEGRQEENEAAGPCTCYEGDLHQHLTEGIDNTMKKKRKRPIAGQPNC